jgi:hypothetical protein
MGLEEGRGVGGEERHPVPRLETRGVEGPNEPIDPVLELPVAVAAVTVHHRDAIRED